MLIASLTRTNGETVLFIGVSRANFERLRTVAPNAFVISNKLLPGCGLPENTQVCVLAGETETELQSILKPYLSDNTVVSGEAED